MSKQFKPKRYTEEEMEALRKNPNVLEVLENRLSLTIEFRQQVYEGWVLKPERANVRRILEVNGFDTQKIGQNFTQSVESVFKRGGRPKYSKASSESQKNWSKTVYMPTRTADELVESGKFVWDINRLILHPDFEAELYKNYPNQTIEDGLLACGISLADVGYHKIYWLKEKFEQSLGKDTIRSMKTGRSEIYDAVTVKRYANHPYIMTATREKISLQTTFFRDAVPMSSMPIDDILKVFDIEPSIFSATERYRISRVLNQWIQTNGADVPEVIPTREILRNRMNALDNIVETNFHRIAVPAMNVLERKELCLWIRELSSDPGRKYTISYILSLTGISRASYYAILKNENYGQAIIKRNEQDKHDAKLIKKVTEYKGRVKADIYAIA